MKLNFVNLMKIIINYIGESHRTSQVDFMYNIFNYYAMQNKDCVFDNGQVCRWLNGSVAVTPKIIRFYTKNIDNYNHLIDDIKTFLLPSFYDKSKAISDLYNLVINDESLSKQKRAELLQNFDTPEHFIGDLVIFSLERRFEKCKR